MCVVHLRPGCCVPAAGASTEYVLCYREVKYEVRTFVHNVGTRLDKWPDGGCSRGIQASAGLVSRHGFTSNMIRPQAPSDTLPDIPGFWATQARSSELAYWR